jgi:kinesin family member 5
MKEDRIGVFVRVRPYQEKEPPSTFILSLDQQAIAVRDPDRDKDQDMSFTFDHIFPVKAQQEEVFQTIGQPIVNAAFEGINATIFAYGQTSSGKTYTCVGPNCDDPQDRGLLPRCVSAIFGRIG